jgi:hypothetical protein
MAIDFNADFRGNQVQRKSAKKSAQISVPFFSAHCPGIEPNILLTPVRL